MIFLTNFFDFFFPFKKKIRVEMATWDTAQGVHREFYTLRCLLSYLFTDFARARKDLIAADKFYFMRGSIAYDSSNLAGFTTSFGNLALTVAGPDPGVIIGFMGDSPVPAGTPAYAGVSTIAFNGRADAGAVIKGGSLGGCATGSNNCTWPGVFSGTAKQRWAISFSGVDQSNMIGAENGFEDPNTDTTTTDSNDVIVTIQDNSMVVDIIGALSNQTSFVAGGGQTTRFSDDTGGYRIACSTEPTTAKGSVAMSWTWTNNSRYSHVMLEVVEPQVSDIMEY